MSLILSISQHTGVRLAEVAFLFILFAGVWLATAHATPLKSGSARSVGAGVALAIAAVLLIIATHWGHFG